MHKAAFERELAKYFVRPVLYAINQVDDAKVI